ncbi:MAG TPA: MarR family transcriptional regulator [Patescibacteria group bacterium]|nr:MarR family transcriptional regulator [Patescibacteria group bacterium]
MKTARVFEDLYLAMFHFLMFNKHQITELAAARGLTAMQASTLVFISTAGRPQPMNHLCTMFGCDASNITGLVDGLESKGLVARRENPEDRRVKMLELTTAGQAECKAIITGLAGKGGYLLRTFSEHELAQLTALMQKAAGSYTSQAAKP